MPFPIFSFAAFKTALRGDSLVLNQIYVRNQPILAFKPRIMTSNLSSAAGLKRTSASLDTHDEAAQKHSKKPDTSNSKLPLQSEEALTEEEIHGTELPIHQVAKQYAPRNACEYDFTPLLGPPPKKGTQQTQFYSADNYL